MHNFVFLVFPHELTVPLLVHFAPLLIQLHDASFVRLLRLRCSTNAILQRLDHVLAALGRLSSLETFLISFAGLFEPPEVL